MASNNWMFSSSSNSMMSKPTSGSEVNPVNRIAQNREILGNSQTTWPSWVPTTTRTVNMIKNDSALTNNNKLPYSAMELSPTKRYPQKTLVKECICYREHTNVACCSCGLVLAGRVRIQCPCHPNTIHLMDTERCPECCSSTLSEIRTSP